MKADAGCRSFTSRGLPDAPINWTQMLLPAPHLVCCRWAESTQMLGCHCSRHSKTLGNRRLALEQPKRCQGSTSQKLEGNKAAPSAYAASEWARVYWETLPLGLPIMEVIWILKQSKHSSQAVSQDAKHFPLRPQPGLSIYTNSETHH